MTTVETAATRYQGMVEKVYQAFFSPSQYEMKVYGTRGHRTWEQLPSPVGWRRAGSHNLG